MSPKSRIDLYLRSAENLRRSIERNRDDNAFVESGGEIVYVFDANVFVFHADLNDEKRLTRDFDRLIGQPPRNPLAKAVERLTADFLFSGGLPGQAGTGYISVPHFEEVLLQTERVARDLRHGDRRHRATLDAAQRGELAAIIGSDEPAAVKLERLGYVLPGAWLANLNAKAHFTKALRSAFLDQPGNLVPLDREEWGRAASVFTAQELNLWSNHLPKSPRRQQEAIRDDAQTLQTLVNLTRERREEDGRRFVLVTADEELDRAVQKRLSEDLCDVPNFIRSPRDFLPLMNLKAMGNALGSGSIDRETTAAFERVFETLDSALDWLIAPGNAGADPDRTDDHLAKIEGAWLAASRSATILNADHLAAGADEIFQHVADFIDHEGGATAARLVEASVEEVRRRHVSLVLDSALSDLALARRGHGGDRPRRVGLQLIGDLFSTLLPSDVSLNDFLDRTVELGKLPNDVFERLNRDPGSYDVQLLSCAIFVAAERWAAGIDFGSRALELAIRHHPGSVARRTEAQYLLALCLRFSLRNANQFKQAMRLLDGNLRTYAERRQGGRATLLRRLRDEMELGNLLLAASVAQEISRTTSGRRSAGPGRFVLFDASFSRTHFAMGVKRLTDAREELLNSEGIETPTKANTAALDQLQEWLKILSATNIVGAFVFERIVPGLQQPRACVIDCSDELSVLEAEISVRSSKGEAVRPTQLVYYYAGLALSTSDPDERKRALASLDEMLGQLTSADHRAPVGDRLEFVQLSDWLKVQQQIDESRHLT